MPWRLWRLKLRLKGYRRFFQDVLFTSPQEAEAALNEFVQHNTGRLAGVHFTKIAIRFEPYRHMWHLEVWVR